MRSEKDWNRCLFAVDVVRFDGFFGLTTFEGFRVFEVLRVGAIAYIATVG